MVRVVVVFVMVTKIKNLIHSHAYAYNFDIGFVDGNVISRLVLSHAALKPMIWGCKVFVTTCADQARAVCVAIRC